MDRIKKFVAIGPESSGKSTLCQQLAAHYQTLWSPEFAREYLLAQGAHYTFDDLLAIAEGQIHVEEECQSHLQNENSHLLFVDTNMQVMRVWSEYVFNDCHYYILDQIAEREYDGYFLCAPDLPWQPDALREHPDQNVRDELFHFYRELLTDDAAPWIVIEGDYAKRLRAAIDFVDQRQ